MDTIRRNRHLTVAATAAAAAVSWAVVTKGIGVHLVVRLPHAAPSVVGLGPIVGVSAGATLLGWVTLGVLQRRDARALRSWTLLAVVVFGASLALPVGFATTTAAVVGLVAIHLVVASTAIVGVRRSSAATRAPADSVDGDRHLLVAS